MTALEKGSDLHISDLVLMTAFTTEVGSLHLEQPHNEYLILFPCFLYCRSSMSSSNIYADKKKNLRIQNAPEMPHCTTLHSNKEK